MQKLMPLVVLSGSAGYSIHAMQQETILAKQMSNEIVLEGIKGFPQELKRHIIFFLLQTHRGYRFSLLKKLPDIDRPFFDVVFTPNGEVFGICTGSDTLYLRSSNTGEVTSTLKGPTDHIFAEAFSSDGELFGAGLEDTTAGIWDSKTKALRILAGHTSCVSSVVFSPNGKTVFTGTQRDKIAYLWDAKTGVFLKALPINTKLIIDPVFSPNGETILIGTNQGTAYLWSSETGELVTTFQGHNLNICSLTFSSNGETILAGYPDQTVYVWDSKTGEVLHIFKEVSTGSSSVEFSPDAETFITIPDYGNNACLWSSKTGELVTTFQGHTGRISCVSFSSNGELLLTGSEDATVRVWNVQTGELLTTLDGHTMAITALGVSPDKGIVVTGSEDGTACIWRSLWNLEGLTSEQKRAYFKHFMTYYPLLQDTSNSVNNDTP